MKKMIHWSILPATLFFLGVFSAIGQNVATPSVGAASGVYSGPVPSMDGLSEAENAELPRTLYARYFDRSLLPGEPLDAEGEKLTAIAQTLAGLAPVNGNTLGKITKTEAYAAHEAFFAQVWKTVDESHLVKARAFGAENVDDKWNTHGGLFYPFSGPDFLFANTFFPNVDQYILAGLEPTGEVPNMEGMDPKGLQSSLKSLQKSLDDILRWSFFRTLDMEVDFRYNQFKGTIPVIMTFMAKTDHEILSIKHVGLDSLATLVPVKFEDRTAMWQKTIEGVEFKFRKKGSGKIKSLVYFSVNLHDGPMAEQPEISAMVRKMRYPACYLKSASYLMHKDYFSKVRNIILNHCSLVLQDPSGIPVRFFPEDKWTRFFYGKYTGPISLFSNYNQGDLAEIYRNTPNIPPLSFGIGYKFNVGTSSFMLALSKQAQNWHEEAMKASNSPTSTAAVSKETPSEEIKEVAVPKKQEPAPKAEKEVAPKPEAKKKLN